MTNEQATTKARVMADKMATYKLNRFTFIEGVKIEDWADVKNTVTRTNFFEVVVSSAIKSIACTKIDFLEKKSFLNQIPLTDVFLKFYVHNNYNRFLSGFFQVSKTSIFSKEEGRTQNWGRATDFLVWLSACYLI